MWPAGASVPTRPTALTADLAKVGVTQQQNGTDHDNR